MALTDENGMNTTMLVSPSPNAMPYPVYGNNGGFGDFGGNGWWIILLFILLGGNGFGGWGMGNAGMIGSEIYPWMNQANLTTSGFQSQMLYDNVTSMRDGISDLSTQICGGFGNVQTSLCNGFAGVNATINSGFANAETAANARQMNNMQQAFAGQTAVMQGFNNAGAQLSDLKYTVATENCADRAAGEANTRAIIDSQTRGTQAILDKLCALELDGVKSQVAAEQRENNNLRTELMYARGQASQIEQTSQIENNLYNRLKNCPVNCVPVYGNQSIFTCPNNGFNGCGCGG